MRHLRICFLCAAVVDGYGVLHAQVEQLAVEDRPWRVVRRARIRFLGSYVFGRGNRARMALLERGTVLLDGKASARVWDVLVGCLRLKRAGRELVLTSI